MSPFLPEVFAAWTERVAHEAPLRALVLVAVALVVYAVRARTTGSRLRIALIALLTVGAVVAAAERASVVDDAFIAFRYARNLLEGHGLVYNLDERVEGYTDLLWVLLVALGSRVSGVELPGVALALNLGVVAANVALVAANARRLFPSANAGFPLAALLLAGHGVFLAHGTTGLETGLVALLAQAGLYLLSGPGVARAAALGGCALVLAVLTRPDAALLLPIAAVAVALRALRGDERAPLLRALAALALPGVVLLAVQAWRLSYYGDWLPNTAYTKSAGGAYWSQGLVYLTDFWLGSATLPWAIVAGVWAARGSAPLHARVYVGLVVLLQTVYVARIGGDFMSGRFFVVLLPLLALAAEGAWRDLRPRRPAAAAALVGLLVAGLGAGSLVRSGSLRWYLADEGTLYPVTQWAPVTIEHPSFHIGHAVQRGLTARGITPTMAAGTIGMLGYYGGLPLIDLHGLTDRTVARSGSGARGHIGHEKMARPAYLKKRGVTLVQSESFCGDTRWLPLRGVGLPTGENRKKPWCFLVWDPALAARMREASTGWTLPDPEAWIDAYILSLPTQAPADVAETLAFLDGWYFAVVSDPARRAPIAARAAVAGSTLP
jgi:hypothetical protein